MGYLITKLLNKMDAIIITCVIIDILRSKVSVRTPLAIMNITHPDKSSTFKES